MSQDRRGRRRTVAFEQVEEPGMRQFRLAATGASVQQALADRPRRMGTYWCGACFTDHAPSVRWRRIYIGTEVPEGAECADCYIRIRELQEMLA